MNADERIADLENRISRLENLLNKVIAIAMANPFAKAYVKKILEDK